MSGSRIPLMPIDRGGRLFEVSGLAWLLLGLLNKASAEKGEALTSGLGVILALEGLLGFTERSTDISDTCVTGVFVSGFERLRTLATNEDGATAGEALIEMLEAGVDTDTGLTGVCNNTCCSLEPELRSKITVSGLEPLSEELLFDLVIESLAFCSSDLGLP